MADIIVDIFMKNLIKLLGHEANLLLKVKGQVCLLQDDLGIMNAFLKDSGGKRNEHHLVREIINQIRDVVLEVEDVIDIYMVKVIKQRRRTLLGRAFHSIGHANLLHDVSNQTTSIKNKIRNIYDNKATFGIGEVESNANEEAEQSLQRRRRNVEEEDVVGFVNDTATLVKKLVEGTLKRQVVSIIGMGGLGKTTLAKKIYNNSRVKNHFDCRAWVNGSQECKSKELLLGISRCVEMEKSDELHKMSEEELRIALNKHLKGKRYLIVLDDIWKVEIWDEVGAAFPEDLNGSRILITSRIKEVATHASSTPPHLLPFLDKNESWELFRKKVFRGENCPSNLETLGIQLAESCKGLPLSIVVLGGLLAKQEKSPRIWEKMIGKVNSYLTDNRTKCLDILALSYNHLPGYLKSCFLYFGMFPEGHKINARELMKLWMAEGFIQPIGNREVDDIAEDYLEELIDRSLIQVASKRSDGGVKSCCIHDLLRDLCIKESVKEKFFEIHSDADPSESSMIKARRLSIQGNTCNYFLSRTCDPKACARSLFLFSEQNNFDSNHWRWIYKGFKFIRVSYLWNVNLHSFPSQIRNLIYLKYLRINSEMNFIPASICKLQFLEVFDLRSSSSESILLPKGIWMMNQLRHLKVSRSLQLPDPAERITGTNPLRNLQVISALSINQKTTLLIRKSLFPNLRKLHLLHKHNGIRNWTGQEVLELLTSLEDSLPSLRVLKTESLWKFSLNRFDMYPESLTKITNISSIMVPEHFRILGKLPNLRILKLKDVTLNGSGTQRGLIRFVAGEFPKLEVIKMISVEIVTWEMERDAMPSLQHLVINFCYPLRNLPNELCRLTHLRLIEVSNISKELWNMLKDLNMNNGCKLIMD
ncbi:putative disease resistance RPP13-like protein 3 [Ziziphus jujuba]|uniref:Disease resistance RPP13-like protein 3 n=1 Tax=Ziziphus jujuba TaxID=326968 RepID=A0A6P4ATZ0_ZIZJJ|nr:putative disease resistance RPP13-like protein 3 [Ziziphus jujuba]